MRKQFSDALLADRRHTVKSGLPEVPRESRTLYLTGFQQIRYIDSNHAGEIDWIHGHHSNDALMPKQFYQRPIPQRRVLIFGWSR